MFGQAKYSQLRYKTTFVSAATEPHHGSPSELITKPGSQRCTLLHKKLENLQFEPERMHNITARPKDALARWQKVRTDLEACKYRLLAMQEHFREIDDQEIFSCSSSTDDDPENIRSIWYSGYLNTYSCYNRISRSFPGTDKDSQDRSSRLTSSF